MSAGATVPLAPLLPDQQGNTVDLASLSRESAPAKPVWLTAAAIKPFTGTARTKEYEPSRPVHGKRRIHIPEKKPDPDIDPKLSFDFGLSAREMFNIIFASTLSHETVTDSIMDFKQIGAVHTNMFGFDTQNWAVLK